jgi:hypothetical protein
MDWKGLGYWTADLFVAAIVAFMRQARNNAYGGLAGTVLNVAQMIIRNQNGKPRAVL